MRRHRVVIAPFILIAAILFMLPTQMACGAKDLGKLHDTLNSAAKSLNAAAKTNRQFYDAGTYGVIGSPQAIEWRQKGATAIHAANEKLITALNLAKNLTTETFEQGKIAVLQALSQAAASLHTGNQTLDLVLQGIAAVINQAVIFINAFQAKDLHFIVPRIQSWKLTMVEV